MTEFFDHLVLRSHASPGEMPAGEILRPRLPSLFEAPGGRTASVPAAPVETQGEEGQLDGAAAENRKRLSHTIAGMPRAHGPTRNDRITEETHPEPGEGQFQAGFENNPPERRIGDAGLLRAREPGNAAARPENIRPLPAPEVGEQVRGPDPERGKADGSNEQAEGPGGRRVLLPRLEPFRPAPLPAPADRFSAAQRRLPVPIASESPEASLQPPTVHISIGRIEVRAVTPPAQPAARTPPAPRPKLSLDEYLRQRNEGKR